MKEDMIMKKIYQSPEVEVMNFAAAEKLAALGLECELTAQKENCTG